MKFKPMAIIDDYPENEKSKLEELSKLFSEWHQYFASPSSGFEEQVPNSMVFDGFYPYYFRPKLKMRILFIGREALDMAVYEEDNYIEVLYKCYRSKEKRIGNRHLNRHAFHKRMLKISYGILNGITEWDKIDKADKLSETFGQSNGWSFAFINISKLSNDSEKWAADWNLINTSFRLSTEGRNFIEEEIKILEPDIIIAMNLKEKLDKLGKPLSDWIFDPAVNSRWIESCGHRSLLLDSWHFSAPGFSDVSDYYDPICKVIRRNEPAIIAGKHCERPDSLSR